ncbi:MAG TPA: hypothetical protein VGL31_18505, partial [Xanthobacteraceae bacterium]
GRDSFCARRRRKSAVGAEESLRRGRTKESAQARKQASKKKVLAFVAGDSKQAVHSLLGEFLLPLPACCRACGKRKWEERASA